MQIEICTPARIQKNAEEMQYPLCVITKFIIEMRLKIVSPPLILKSDQTVSNSTNINNPTSIAPVSQKEQRCPCRFIVLQPTTNRSLKENLPPTRFLTLECAGVSHTVGVLRANQQNVYS